MCYLPTTLVVLALMIRLHDRTDRQLRIQAGLAGYIAALVAVPVVGAMPDQGRCTVCHCTVCCLVLSTGLLICASCWEWV